MCEDDYITEKKKKEQATAQQQQGGQAAAAPATGQEDPKHPPDIAKWVSQSWLAVTVCLAFFLLPKILIGREVLFLYAMQLTSYYTNHKPEYHENYHTLEPQRVCLFCLCVCCMIYLFAEPQLGAAQASCTGLAICALQYWRRCWFLHSSGSQGSGDTSHVRQHRASQCHSRFRTEGVY